jgi:signal-transduction protein with cAMP-binding, CBS, and nucleotidyltransferase domain
MNQTETLTPDATTAADLMTPNPRILHPDNVLQDAATLMRDLDIGMIFVVDGDLLCGVITDRDIALRGSGGGYEPITTTIENAMTHDIVHVRDHATVDDILETMAHQRVRRVSSTPHWPMMDPCSWKPSLTQTSRRCRQRSVSSKRRNWRNRWRVAPLTVPSS